MPRSAQGGASGGVVEGRAQGGASGGGGFRRTPSRAADDENMVDGDDVREHGSFYVPALQGGAAQAPQSVGSLQDAIDRLMRKVPEECKDCNDDLSQKVRISMAETWQNAPYAEQLAICIRLQHAHDNAFSDWLRSGWSERPTYHQRRCVELKKKNEVAAQCMPDAYLEAVHLAREYGERKNIHRG